MCFYDKWVLIISRQSVMFIYHRLGGKEDKKYKKEKVDVTFFICWVTLHDHMIKVSYQSGFQ